MKPVKDMTTEELAEELGGTIHLRRAGFAPSIFINGRSFSLGQARTLLLRDRKLKAQTLREAAEVSGITYAAHDEIMSMADELERIDQ